MGAIQDYYNSINYTDDDTGKALKEHNDAIAALTQNQDDNPDQQPGSFDASKAGSTLNNYVSALDAKNANPPTANPATGATNPPVPPPTTPGIVAKPEPNPNPTPQPQIKPNVDANAPINFSGVKDPIGQANVLYNALKKYGVNLNDFVVGGTSPYDTQIMQNVDVINNPNSTEAQRQGAAQNIQSLSNLRNSSVSGEGQFRFVNGVAQPVTTTPSNMIKGMFDPANPYGNSPLKAYADFMRPSPTYTNQPGFQKNLNDLSNNSTTQLSQDDVSAQFNPNKPDFGVAGAQEYEKALNGSPSSQFSTELQNLISQFGQGGVTDEQRRVEEAQLIQEIQNSDSAARQQTADSLAGNGIQGGAMADALARQTQSSNAAKDSGLSTLRLGILQQQQHAKEQALTAIFQQQGLDQQKAAQLAQMVAGAQQNQVSNQLQIGGQQQQGKQAALSAFLQQEGLDNESAQWMANELATMQNNQTNAAINYTGQQTGYGLQQRGQDMTYLMHLLDLASAGDENAKRLAAQMLSSLYGDTPANVYNGTGGGGA